tara:strand:- start:4049 stop:4537 length:489 start_codon:yes stop_codon:yes gene_type:complete
MNFGRTIWSTATSVVAILSLGATALAVPVVPNFTQGSMTSHTETTSTVTETINSVDFRTGWEYSVTGTGVSNGGNRLNPTTNTSTVNVAPATNGVTGEVTGQVTSSFDSLDLSNQAAFTITTPGQAFQFTQTYSGPGMTNQTIIQRTTTIESVTDTTSTFTQ